MKPKLVELLMRLPSAKFSFTDVNLQDKTHPTCCRRVLVAAAVVVVLFPLFPPLKGLLVGVVMVMSLFLVQGGWLKVVIPHLLLLLPYGGYLRCWPYRLIFPT